MDTKEKEFYDAILIAAAIIGFLLVYFIFSIIRQQRKNQRLSKTKILAEIKTLENERKRIASDLHDEIGPLLSTVKFQIAHLDAIDKHEQELIAKSGEHIDMIIKRMREIANDLLPNILERRGLVLAIEDFINRTNGQKNLNITFVHQIANRIPKDIELNIYRIIQEIIHNTIKHAQANVLKISVQTDQEILRLLTADDGKGFNFEEIVRQKKGLGLLNLQSRTEIMKGEFKVLSASAGTSYIFEIPIGKLYATS